MSTDKPLPKPAYEDDDEPEDVEQQKRRYVAQVLAEQNAIRAQRLVEATCRATLARRGQVDPNVLATATMIATQSLLNSIKAQQAVFPGRTAEQGRPTKVVLKFTRADRPAGELDQAAPPAPPSPAAATSLVPVPDPLDEQDLPRSRTVEILESLLDVEEADDEQDETEDELAPLDPAA